jgi:hypothetical protein
MYICGGAESHVSVLFLAGVGDDDETLATAFSNGPAVLARKGRYVWNWAGMVTGGGKTCPSDTLSADHIRKFRRWNSGLRGKKRTANRLCLHYTNLNPKLLKVCKSAFVRMTSSMGKEPTRWWKRKWRGRALAQAVGRRLPTAEARVRAQIRSCGIFSGQSGAREGFLRILLFPLPILISPTASRTWSSIIRGWYKGQTMAVAPSGLSLTPNKRN